MIVIRFLSQDKNSFVEVMLQEGRSYDLEKEKVRMAVEAFLREKKKLDSLGDKKK